MIYCDHKSLTQRGTMSQSHKIYGVPIENICCHQPLSTVTQFVGIYDHFRVLPTCQSLLLILALVQYPLKVESPCSVVVW